MCWSGSFYLTVCWGEKQLYEWEKLDGVEVILTFVTM